MYYTRVITHSQNTKFNKTVHFIFDSENNNIKLNQSQNLISYWKFFLI